MIVVNGAIREVIPADDRGLAYGDGVFRTLRVREGKVLHWPRQYAKLAHDCATLAIKPPAMGVLEAELATACADAGDAAVKVIVTRGGGPRGYAYAAVQATTRVVLTAPIPAELRERGRAGVSVRLCRLRLAAQPALAGVKHLNRLENVLARAEWDDLRIAEGLLTNAEGDVICGTMTNVFAVMGGELRTPALDQCGVAGVTRDRVMAAAAASGVGCAVGRLQFPDLLAADEVFLTNSLIGVWPVVELEGAMRSIGAVTRALQEALEREDAQVA